ncbi:hypothetical protein Droror1_Dr00006213 [Drosera rotundifolia]
MSDLVTGDRYLDSLVSFLDNNATALIDGTLTLKLNPIGLHYVQSRLEALAELEGLISGAPVDYLRAYVSDLGDHRALERLRRIFWRVKGLKVLGVEGMGGTGLRRDPTRVSVVRFGRLRVLELRGCDVSTSAAKGLLELRHCLEKLICHNSTDALRHVFASRIADIKNSPQWTRLSFVSCACNGLKLMDESLQLLPAIETLDLSRNKFAKVDNLRKCTKLTHLDLGFNQLRSVAYFTEVSTHISKLVLRNNALTTLRGLENLQSLEDLDLSYNIISNFSELEVLSGISSLKNLWLEGNPLSCARWYRPQVYSFFGYPDMLIQLKVDDKGITTKEFWKRQILIAGRQKRPASYGFYIPVRENVEEEGPPSSKTKKMSRVACIENEDSSLGSEHETVSRDKEIRSGEDNIISDEEAEIVGFQNKIEFMKKEHSSLRLQELNEWIDQASSDAVHGSKLNVSQVEHHGGVYLKHDFGQRQNSRHNSTSNQASEDHSGTRIQEPDLTFADSSITFHGPRNPETSSEIFPDVSQRKSVNAFITLEQSLSLLSSSVHGRDHDLSFTGENSGVGRFATKRKYMFAGVNVKPLTAISNIVESQSLIAEHGSPPQYQKDILHRRQYLEEEYLQLSVDSFSVASSDSVTSSDEEESLSVVSILPETESVLTAVVNQDSFGQSSLTCEEGRVALLLHANGQCSGSQCEQVPLVSVNGIYTTVEFGEKAGGVMLEADRMDLKSKRKPKRRVVSLLESNAECTDEELGTKKELAQVEDEMKQQAYDSCIEKDQNEFYERSSAQQATGVLAEEQSDAEVDDYVKDYFDSILGANETCIEYITCDCLLEPEVHNIQREVVVLASSERNLYVLPRNLISEGPEDEASLVSSYIIEDVTGVLLGLGLHVVRLYIRGDAAHIFMTRSAEKSEQLLHMLEIAGFLEANKGFHLSSLEQIQIGLFYKHICGGSEISIHHYCMVLFRHDESEEDRWVSRSLFVTGGWLFLCVEDILHFNSHLMDEDFPQYLLLDSSFFIGDINKMVVEVGEKRCEISISRSDQSPRDNESCLTGLSAIMGSSIRSGCRRNTLESARTWQLKWFSEESLTKFLALIKAIHAGVARSSLSMEHVS